MLARIKPLFNERKAGNYTELSQLNASWMMFLWLSDERLPVQDKKGLRQVVTKVKCRDLRQSQPAQPISSFFHYLRGIDYQPRNRIMSEATLQPSSPLGWSACHFNTLHFWFFNLVWLLHAFSLRLVAVDLATNIR